MSLENIKMPKFAFGMMRLPETEEGMDLEQINKCAFEIENGFKKLL